MRQMEHLEIPPPEDKVPAAPANGVVKILPFWTTNPRAWFTSAERSFRLPDPYKELRCPCWLRTS
jgi:hypothetical protein